MNRLFIAVLALSVGCSGDSASKSTETGSPGTDSGAVDSATPAVSDEDLLREAIAGETDAEATLLSIADRGGLPVQTTTGTVLFACLCGDGGWSVAGDHDDWAGTPMEQSGALWWAEVEVPTPDGSRYKFTDGSQWIPDPLGRRLAYDDNGELSLVDASFAHLQRWYAVEGGGLEPRSVQVWVPAGGRFTHAVYAHDGQNLFDPGAFHGGWRLDQSLPPELIVFGIDNTAARFDEYTPTTDDLGSGPVGGKSDDYGVLIDGLRDRMDEAYGPAERYGLLGSSLGGLVSVALAERDPGSWDMAMSLSGTMGWGSLGTNGETMLDLAAASGALSGVAIYADSGGGGECVDADGDGMNDDGDDSDNYCSNRQLVDQLAASTHTWDTDLWHWHEPGAEHTEAAWAARVWRPLEIFAGL
jgi:hypothetical protein